MSTMLTTAQIASACRSPLLKPDPEVRGSKAYWS
jgi:hypothetical protein